MLFNTIFSEPDGYVHGGRAVPNEKLLWWLFRFDPADQASPDADLRLLVELDQLKDVTPPEELVRIWRRDLVVGEGEHTDTAYRRRLARFMCYARRWYALASEEGFKAYFPFHHFADYLAALDSSPEELASRIPTLIRGLNLLLSNGQVGDDLELKVFYLAAEGARQGAVVYSPNTAIDADSFHLVTDLSADDIEENSGVYLERLPRRLYLCCQPRPDVAVRLPVSLQLYEVLLSAASPTSGFPATLWSKERDTVVRFMASLSRTVQPDSKRIEFAIVMNGDATLKLTHHRSRKRIDVS